jgi:ABC-type multidrug transport system fused ATPase/permease subunit
MGTFLLILLLVVIYFIAAPIIKVWRKVRQFQDQYNRTMEGQDASQQSYETKTEEEELKERYRRYTKSEAQNVDFEELDGPMQQESSPNQASQSTGNRYQEEAISDAEFEEI